MRGLWNLTAILQLLLREPTATVWVSCADFGKKPPSLCEGGFLCVVGSLVELALDLALEELVQLDTGVRALVEDAVNSTADG